MSDDTDSDKAIALQRIEAMVCDLCMNGAGGECHVPGCAFWMHDAPAGVTLDWLRGRREVTALIETDIAGGAERAASEKRWNDAIDWLLNSRHTADPDIQGPFWDHVDGKITLDKLRAS